MGFHINKRTEFRKINYTFVFNWLLTDLRMPPIIIKIISDNISLFVILLIYMQSVNTEQDSPTKLPQSLLEVEEFD